jgi:hypothetical protein
MMRFVFEQTKKAYEKAKEGFFPDKYYNEVNEVINNNNFTKVVDIVEELSICELELEKIKVI